MHIVYIFCTHSRAVGSREAVGGAVVPFQFLVDQLIQSQSRGWGGHIKSTTLLLTRLPRFSDLPTALHRNTSFDVEDLGLMKIHPYPFYLLHWLFFVRVSRVFMGCQKVIVMYL